MASVFELVASLALVILSRIELVASKCAIASCSFEPADRRLGVAAWLCDVSP
jgi:hypothetical protein